jgi:stage V sporulation protein AC
MTNAEYSKYVQSKSKKSPLAKDMLLAFLVGGAICTIGQIFMNLYKQYLTTIDAATATSMTMIFIGSALTGLDVYNKIARFAGAGTIVPITGFANSITSPAMEFKSEGLVLGMAAKMFVVAGPVIVFGTCASIIYGLILQIFSLV